MDGIGFRFRHTGSAAKPCVSVRRCMPYSTVRCGEAETAVAAGILTIQICRSRTCRACEKTASDEFAEDFVGREEAAFRNMDP